MTVDLLLMFPSQTARKSTDHQECSHDSHTTRVTVLAEPPSSLRAEASRPPLRTCLCICGKGESQAVRTTRAVGETHCAQHRLTLN